MVNSKINGWQVSFKEPSFGASSWVQRKLGYTDLYDAQNKRAVLKVILETEVDLTDVLARLRIIDIHVDQGNRPAL